ncbi:MAG: carboxypeptidase regulatory-like domain-containing protein [Treponema sp.]|mgnify:CR=1 FL=1|nr:carboxypeptidase regulatory-like domain-containing protein [Treponema sp.]
MKKIALFLFSLLAISLFAGCASMPESNGKDSTLIYGCARYNGLYVFGGKDKSMSSVKIDGIQVMVMNLDDGMTYAATTNSEGEFTIAGVTPGHYIVKYLGTEYKYDGKKWKLRYNVPSKEKSNFTVRNGVTNIGRIVVNVDPDSGCDYVTWATDLEKVAELFKKNHPGSKWLDANWSTPLDESAE